MEAISQAVNAVDSVCSFDEVVDSRADIVVYFDNSHGPQALRTEWLKNHRGDFEIVDYSVNGQQSWMQLKA